ncbi:unannotated protein [freshwater metagenome]|uniref:Unannotated protein n=1 Tax=freshwater metagenome TaxID=449393 RepID=A0A6J7GWD3_9ZZZZ|nr:phosphatase PAP2 family protein [Actinomycetota bacterium]MSW91534.1 phosphatase PAP2 family protein [Actinomycetota bacterium]MSY71263.1 phosphatase PAP2 family protein [Actinomycetota bacterium]
MTAERSAASADRGRARQPLILGVAVAALTGVFVKLWDSVGENDATVRLDHRWTAWVVTHRSPGLIRVMRVVTHLADGWTIVVVVALTVVVLRVRRLPGALLVVAATSSTAIVVGVVKSVVGRARPPAIDAATAASGYAFPSGHSAQAAACFGALGWIAASKTRRRRAWVVLAGGFLTLIVMVGASRVVLGVHWFSDVVAGWTVGGAAVLCVLAVTSARGGQIAPIRRSRRNATRPGSTGSQ